MEIKEFVNFRKKLGKTQKEMAQLLGVSIKAIHSYEQGWRSIPAHIERQVLFLLFRKLGLHKETKKCWEVKGCSDNQRAKCPAWEFKTGDLCWFINGTICNGTVLLGWKEKMAVCRSCEVFTAMMGAIENE